MEQLLYTFLRSEVVRGYSGVLLATSAVGGWFLSFQGFQRYSVRVRYKVVVVENREENTPEPLYRVQT